MRHSKRILFSILTTGAILYSVPATAKNDTTYLECNVLDFSGLGEFSVRINKTLENATHILEGGKIDKSDIFITPTTITYKFLDKYSVIIYRKSLVAVMKAPAIYEKRGRCNKIDIGKVKI